MIFRFSFIEKILLRLNVIPQPVIDSVSLLMTARAMHMAVRLGISDALTTTPRPASAIARQAQVSERGAMIVLDCLEALGYVRKSADQYSFTPQGAKFLAADSNASFRNMMLLGDFTFHNLTQLEETIRNGKPHENAMAEFSPEVWNFFTPAMLELARTNVEEVTKLTPVPATAKRLIDLGGSHGLYSIELCKRFPGLNADIMDVEGVREFAEKLVAEHQMTARVKYKTGDFMKNPIGTGYNVALAHNILHGMDEAENRKFIKLAFASLTEGGTFVILDQIRGTEGKTPLSRLMTSSMGMNLFHHAGGRTYGFEEIRAWLTEAGFKKTDLKKLRTPGFGLVIGKK